MNYASSKQKELPISGTFVLKPDNLLGQNGPRTNEAIIVREGRIEYVGHVDSVPAQFSDVPIVDLPGITITPGFVDAHHHVIEPFVKSLTCGEPAQMWKRIWMPLEAHVDAETCYAGAKWTFLEALRGGITTIVEHAVRSETLAQAVHAAANDIGIRLVSSVGGYDLSNFSSAAEKTPEAAAGIDATLRLAERHIENCRSFETIYPSVACGTVQSNSRDMIKALAEFGREKNILFQIHANEHTGEIQASVEAYGRRPIEFLHDIGALGPQTLLAHATLTTPEEIRMMAATDTAVSYNPVACIWKGNKVAPALDYLERGIRVGLGSDATRNDGFRMLDAAEACQRIAYGMPADDFSCGAGWRWFNAATHGGASVAGLGTVTGVIAAGYAADLLLLNNTHPEVNPSWDLPWEMVRFFDRADIAAVYVNGRLSISNGRPVRFDMDSFIADSLPRGREVVENAGIVRLHPTSMKARQQNLSSR